MQNEPQDDTATGGVTRRERSGGPPEARSTRQDIDPIAARPDAPTLAEQFQPGVDPAHAAESFTAGLDRRAGQDARARRSSVRWLVPGAALTVLMLGFFGIALTMQLIVPIIGIVLTMVLFVAMVVVSRRVGDDRRRARMLGRLMLGLAVTLLVLGVLYYVIAASGFVASVPPV